MNLLNVYFEKSIVEMVYMHISNRYNFEGAVLDEILKKPKSQEHIEKNKRTEVLNPVVLSSLPKAWFVYDVLCWNVQDQLNVDVAL